MKIDIESTERDRPRTPSRSSLARLSLIMPLVGCSHAPEYSIFGSFFPVWIFCSVIGIALAMGARVAVARTVIGGYVAAPVLFYLAMATFLSCMLWLLFYS